MLLNKTSDSNGQKHGMTMDSTALHQSDANMQHHHAKDQLAAQQQLNARM